MKQTTAAIQSKSEIDRVIQMACKKAANLPIKRIRTKSCERCQKTNEILYRVRIDESRMWIFVCPSCLQVVKPSNPLYQYGGTWKSKKRH